jgi:hypothetical protein
MDSHRRCHVAQRCCGWRRCTHLEGLVVSSFDWFVIGEALGFLAAVATHRIFYRQKPTPLSEDDGWTIG